MTEVVVEQLEAAIQAGGVDVLVEVVSDDPEKGARYAQVVVTADEPLDLSFRDVEALHDLTGRVLAVMKPESAR